MKYIDAHFNMNESENYNAEWKEQTKNSTVYLHRYKILGNEIMYKDSTSVFARVGVSERRNYKGIGGSFGVIDMFIISS